MALLNAAHMLRVLTVGFQDVGQPVTRAPQLTVQDGGVPPLQTEQNQIKMHETPQLKNTILQVKTLAQQSFPAQQMFTLSTWWSSTWPPGLDSMKLLHMNKRRQRAGNSCRRGGAYMY